MLSLLRRRGNGAGGRRDLVPVGAIAPLVQDAALPAEWVYHTDADGKFIIGAGGTHAINDTGAGTNYAFNETLLAQPAGAHNHLDFGGFDTEYYPFGAGSKYEASSLGEGDHEHGFTVNRTLDCRRRSARLVRKTTKPSLTLPSNVNFFGVDNLVMQDVTRAITHATRMLQAAEAFGTGGTNSHSFSIMSAAAGEHTHQTLRSNRAFPLLGFPSEFYYPTDAETSHTHQMEFVAALRVKRRKLSLWGITEPFPGDYQHRAIVPGVILMYAGDIIPRGWRLCDGSDGTLDMRDFFVEINGSGSTETLGDNTVEFTGTMRSAGHQHQGAYHVEQVDVISSHYHSGTVTHTHEFLATQRAYKPPYYALAFIQFMG